MSGLNVEAVIGKYIKIREKKSRIEKEAEEAVALLKKDMSTLESWIKTQADAMGVTSFKTDSGTAFLTTTDFASVADWDAVLEFIKTNDAYDMLEKRVSKTAVRGYLAVNKAVPPGVSYGTRLDVNIRKPSSKAED